MSATALSASQAIIDLFDDYVIPNYRRQPIALVRGEGSRVWDADGRLLPGPVSRLGLQHSGIFTAAAGEGDSGAGSATDSCAKYLVY